MKNSAFKYFSILSALLLIAGYAQAAVESVYIRNESGESITVNVVYEDKTSQNKSLAAGEKTVFNVEDTCLKEVYIYSGRWNNVSDVQYDDKLVIPESWDRCQNWEFTIKKRIYDETVHIASKKRIPVAND